MIKNLILKFNKNKAIIKEYLAKNYISLLIALMGTIFYWIIFEVLLFSGANNPISQSLKIDAIVRVLLAFFGTEFIVSTISRFIEFKKNWLAFESYQKTLENIPKPLRAYAATAIEEKMSDLRSNIEQLYNDGLKKQSLQDKLNIVTELLPFANNGIERKYWATTLDSPAEMFEKYRDFFDAQEEKLKCKSRRRLVVIEEKDLENEISDCKKRKFLTDFIDWHTRNDFDLKFLIGSKSKYAERLQENIKTKRKNEIVVDFAIIDDEWIYGEVDIPGETDDSKPNRHLRLNQKRFSYGGLLRDYVEFFNHIWNFWDGERWNILTVDQVRSECIRNDNKDKCKNILKQYYNYLDNKSGDDLFNLICEKIKNSKKRIIALDIAPMKGELEYWNSKKEYISFMEASKEAANKQCEVSRIHIIKNRVYDQPRADLIYEKIFKPQIEAGINVYLIPIDFLFSSKIASHDFLLADDILFSLAWNEDFSANNVTIEKNLEEINNFDWYRKVYSRVEKKAKLINQLTDEKVVKFLQTHIW